MEKIRKGEWKQLITLLSIVIITFVALSPIPPAKAQVTLTVLTRHASDIQGIFETEFLKTKLASDAGITDITFKAPAEGFWVNMIQAGGIDVAWGGGPTLFDGLADKNLLRNMSASSTVMEEVNVIPDTFAGASLKRSKDGKLVWVAAAVSSFGFTVNEATRSLFDLPMPKKWDDLAEPSYFAEPQLVGVVNAPESTSNTRMYEIMLQGFGWETGWQMITLMSGNSRIYHGSTESLGAVIAGEVAVALTIDFYGFGAQIQNPDCKYIIPEGQSIVNGDPIALTINAANPGAAEAFVKYVLSKEGQAQWLRTTLNRLPVREDAFGTTLGQQRPDLYAVYNETKEQTGIEFNDTLSLSMMHSVIYYFEATITNAHAELVEAWKKVIELYDVNPTAFEALSQELGRPLITQEKAMEINEQMGSDTAFRAQKQSEWYSQAVDKYNKVKEGALHNLLVYVFDEATNEPISGASVSVYFSDGTLAKKAFTNTTGYATFSLLGDDYYVKVQAYGYSDYEGDTFTLDKDTEVSVPMTAIVELYKLTVYVFNEDTNEPISGATVSVYLSDGTLARETSTNATGYATFSLPEDDYYIKVQAYGYYDFEGDTFTLDKDTEVSVPMTVAFALYKLTVYVFNEATNEPISNATVSVYFANGTLARKTSTNTTGYATFLSLPEGDYYVKVQVEGYNDYEGDSFTLNQDRKEDVSMTEIAPGPPTLLYIVVAVVAVIILIAAAAIWMRRRS